MIAYSTYDIFPIVATEGFTTAENRTYAVYQALKNECSHILFIDDDMTFPENTIEMLMEHKEAIVGVASNSRMLPLRPTVAKLTAEGTPTHFLSADDVPKEPFECYSVGMGVALIDLEIFSHIEKPWFQFTALPVGKVIVGEDEHLCNQARAKDYKIICDPRLKIGHVGDYIY